jgi:hypothetical protein
MEWILADFGRGAKRVLAAAGERFLACRRRRWKGRSEFKVKSGKLKVKKAMRLL